MRLGIQPTISNQRDTKEGGGGVLTLFIGLYLKDCFKGLAFLCIECVNLCHSILHRGAFFTHTPPMAVEGL